MPKDKVKKAKSWTGVSTPIHPAIREGLKKHGEKSRAAGEKHGMERYKERKLTDLLQKRELLLKKEKRLLKEEKKRFLRTHV